MVWRNVSSLLPEQERVVALLRQAKFHQRRRRYQGPLLQVLRSVFPLLQNRGDRADVDKGKINVGEQLNDRTETMLSECTM